MQFESLTKFLESWFDKPLAELPKTLRVRIGQDFVPMPWDNLSAGQRRSVALQWDYNHDPALEETRSIDWDRAVVDWTYWQQVQLLTAEDFCILRHVHDPRKFDDDRNSIPGGEGKTLGERVSDDMRIIERTNGYNDRLSLVEWIALAEELSWVIPPYMRAAVGSEDATDAQGQHPKPVTARTIENAFIMLKVGDSNVWWRIRMRNAKRYGLTFCRAGKGRGKAPSLWYPDRIAGWLIDKNHLAEKHVANILRKHFPDFADTADRLDPPKDV